MIDYELKAGEYPAALVANEAALARYFEDAARGMEQADIVPRSTAGHAGHTYINRTANFGSYSVIVLVLDAQ